MSSGATKRPDTPSCRAGDEAGFTLIEVVVSFLVLSLVLVITSQVLMESHRQQARIARHAYGPPIAIVRKQMKADIRAGSAVGGAGLPLLWSRDALVILKPGGQVRYSKVGMGLLREDFAGSVLRSRRVMVPVVNLWRWRDLGVGVQVEFTYPEPRPLDRLTPSAARAESLIAVPRNRRTTRW